MIPRWWWERVPWLSMTWTWTNLSNIHFYYDKTLSKLACGDPVEVLCLWWGMVCSPLMTMNSSVHIVLISFPILALVGGLGTGMTISESSANDDRNAQFIPLGWVEEKKLSGAASKSTCLRGPGFVQQDRGGGHRGHTRPTRWWINCTY